MPIPTRQRPAPSPDRRLPIGAELVPGGVHFRVWARSRRSVEVVAFDAAAARDAAGWPAGGAARAGVLLDPEAGGYFSGTVEALGAGILYGYRLDGGESLFPDPASRFQPYGPHGPSSVVDPARYAWGDGGWPGLAPDGQVLYEVHVGTFTREGTWAAAQRELPALAECGITAVELMPIAAFAGRFGWGYDGVSLFAPTQLYGEPDDLRRFVDRAHALGVGVLLDVVYNHLGPSGNYLGQFSDAYFTDRYENEWGEAIDFDGPHAAAVREFFAANAAYWIDEFHLDGLRLDATQQIFDRSEPHILAEIAETARAAAGPRHIYLVSENEPQDTRHVRTPERGGYGLDALWNDDFHHSALVALTGRGEAYYSDHRGTPQELISAARWGYLYQGQHYTWQRQRRGTPALDLPACAFVNYLQNHDQIANSATGARIHQLAGAARVRAITALLLLVPGTPLLFQGQEFAASAPFLYFADHEPGLAEQVRAGRWRFLTQFPSLARPDVAATLAEPGDPQTFERCKLDHTERARHAAWYALHRDLIRLRREQPAIRAQDRTRLFGAVLSPEALLLRWLMPDADDRVLLVNLGRGTRYAPAPEPLLAPPRGTRWRVLWSSEAPGYGGSGMPEPEQPDGSWWLTGQSAALLEPVTTDGTREGGADA